MELAIWRLLVVALVLIVGWAFPGVSISDLWRAAGDHLACDLSDALSTIGDG